MKVWYGEAPSNIALVKYMGKTGASEDNRPTNRSLSYTLGSLLTFVEIEILQSSSLSDQWQPLGINHRSEKLVAIDLNQTGLKKFLGHLDRIKTKFNVTEKFLVRSANNFPSDCGIASSASSFAALTLAATRACCEIRGIDMLNDHELSKLSRLGSGSSCRSFFAPWSIWVSDGAEGVSALADLKLMHQVVIVDSTLKKKSSSEAHVAVGNGLLFQGRAERAEARLSALLLALTKLENLESRNRRDNSDRSQSDVDHNSGDVTHGSSQAGSGSNQAVPESVQELRSHWRLAFDICWAEFWDMHALFETATPPFGYMRASSLEVLTHLREEYWEKISDGPIVTMDAGANVHLLWRADQGAMALNFVKTFSAKYQVITGALV
jgi:diphosphomevalonate decarboxylase